MSKTKSKSPKNLETLESLQKYWTEERRASAKPKPMPIVEPDNKRKADAKTVEGPLQITTPNISAADFLAGTQKKSVSDLAATPVPTPASWPYSCNGKLFFTWQGNDYVGSAGSIFLEVLLTAAHNIYDGGEWSTNILYYPGYPVYGQSWGWTRTAIFTAWQNNNDFAYDYAMILTSTSMAPVGSMGSIRNLSPQGLTWTAIGYPAAAPYPGNQMYQTTGAYISGTTQITMANNDMTRGSSGGNWLTSQAGVNYVNGVQSHRPSNQPTVAVSPYLNNTDFLNLLQCVSTGNCP